MAALCAAVFVAALDQTVVLTVMPSMMATLHIPYTRINDAGWIVTGYLLGYTVAMPLFGRLADVQGRRLMCVIALGLFMLGSGLCWAAPNLGLFVASRVVQAAGGGALVPIAMAARTCSHPRGGR
jgi:MFS family permease